MIKKELIDKKTLAVIGEGDHLKYMVESEGWQIARKILVKKLVDTGSVLGISGKNMNPENIIAEVAGRQIAVELVYNWLREIEGKVEQHKAHKKIFEELKAEQFVTFFE